MKPLLVTGFLYEVTAELDQLPLVSPAKKVKVSPSKESESDKVNVRKIQKRSNLLA